MYWTSHATVRMIAATIVLSITAATAHAGDVDYEFSDTRYEFMSYPDVEYQATFMAQIPNQADVSVGSAPYDPSVESTPYGQMTVFTLTATVTLPNPPVVGVYGIVQRRTYGGSWTFVGVINPQ